MIYHGDCLEVLRSLPDCSVDAVVTDPPYGLSFMGKRWDYDVPSVEVWAECLRVLKPGGHLLAFAGTRTQHRMAVRIEDAGFEIRDMIAWVYGSGFPKSLDVSKAIDNAAGAEREKVLVPTKPGNAATRSSSATDMQSGFTDISDPVTEAARQWQGWGTALKPALEPITVARKPLAGTVAENVLAHGTGALNVDGCRVETDELAGKVYNNKGDALSWGGTYGKGVAHGNAIGRWPANLIHDGSDEVTRLMTGGEARFFYTAKASKDDRDDGLEGFVPAKTNDGRKVDADNAYQRGATLRANVHPTVKPTDLMRYLCRLVTPPGGTVLDPFMGSGSTGKAAILEGFSFIGIERESEYVEIAKARIASAQAQPKQESLF